MNVKYLLWGILALSWMGCATVNVSKTETAPGVDFTKYKSFEFYALTATGDTVSANFAKNTDLLKEAIVTEMKKRGYTKVITSPDLLINIGIVVTEKIQTRQTDFRTDAPKYMGQRNYSWKSEEVEVGRYKEGTVTVDVVDAAANQMVWKGVAESVLPGKQAKMPDVIREGILKLFEKYPVPVLK